MRDWAHRQLKLARLAFITMQTITIILADAWNVRICLRINRCTLNPEIWNTFEQRTLLASILFVRLNFESSLKLIYGRISKKSNLENSKKSCYLCFEPKRNQTSNLRMWLFQSFKFHNINIPQPGDYKQRDHTTSLEVKEELFNGGTYIRGGLQTEGIMSEGACESNRKDERSWALIKIRFAFLGF